MSTTDDEQPDVLIGVPAIADFINPFLANPMTNIQIGRAIKKGYIPAESFGGRPMASKQVLRQFFTIDAKRSREKFTATAVKRRQANQSPEE